MMNSKRIFTRITVAAAVLLAAAAFPAQASANAGIFGWVFRNLNGSFQPTSLDPDTGAATAGDYTLDVNNLNTWGIVERLVTPTGDLAIFFPGSYNHSTSADVHFEMELTDIGNGANATAQVTGTFFIIDFDGSSIQGSIDGVWTRDDALGGSFGGVLSLVTITSPDDDFFEGVLSNGDVGDSFSTIFDPDQPFTGTGILALDADWFSLAVDLNNPTDMNIDSLGAGVLPAPGAFLLGAMGLSLIGWVKRKFA